MSLISAMLGALSFPQPTAQPKSFGGRYHNNRNHGGKRRRKNPFRGTTYASIIGVRKHC